MAELKSNKHASSEDAVGRVHAAITKIHEKKLELMLEQVEGLSEEDKGDAVFILDTSSINSAMKWTEMQQVGCQAPEKSETTPLGKRLAAVHQLQKDRDIPISLEN